MFSNLKALTIYVSASHYEMDGLCRILDCCNLQFFHLTDQHTSLTPPDIVKLLLCLRQQQYLEALALIMPYYDCSIGSVIPEYFWDGEENLWPRLRLLYLPAVARYDLEELQKFKTLQQLRLQDMLPGLADTDRYAVQMIAKCRQLRVLDLDSLKLGSAQTLVNMARACPLLQKLDVGRLDIGKGPNRDRTLVLALLRALPRLEFLGLRLRFQMDGGVLESIPRHCPRLKVLHLPDTDLCLSLTLIINAPPLHELEIMRLSRVYFENPRHLMGCQTFNSVVAWWRSVFPKLQEMPCTADIYCRYMFEENTRNEGEDDADGGLSLGVPGLDFDDYDSAWFILRTRLWRALGYGKDLDSHEKIRYMWQTNREIETVGWPVVPLEAFCDPVPHSTKGLAQIKTSAMPTSGRPEEMI